MKYSQESSISWALTLVQATHKLQGRGRRSFTKLLQLREEEDLPSTGRGSKESKKNRKKRRKAPKSPGKKTHKLENFSSSWTYPNSKNRSL